MTSFSSHDVVHWYLQVWLSRILKDNEGLSCPGTNIWRRYRLPSAIEICILSNLGHTCLKIQISWADQAISFLVPTWQLVKLIIFFTIFITYTYKLSQKNMIETNINGKISFDLVCRIVTSEKLHMHYKKFAIWECTYEVGDFPRPSNFESLQNSRHIFVLNRSLGEKVPFNELLDADILGVKGFIIRLFFHSFHLIITLLGIFLRICELSHFKIFLTKSIMTVIWNQRFKGNFFPYYLKKIRYFYKKFVIFT